VWSRGLKEESKNPRGDISKRGEKCERPKSGRQRVEEEKGNRDCLKSEEERGVRGGFLKKKKRRARVEQATALSIRKAVDLDRR